MSSFCWLQEKKLKIPHPREILPFEEINIFLVSFHMLLLQNIFGASCASQEKREKNTYQVGGKVEIKSFFSTCFIRRIGVVFSAIFLSVFLLSIWNPNWWVKTSEINPEILPPQFTLGSPYKHTFIISLNVSFHRLLIFLFGENSSLLQEIRRGIF